MLHNTPVQKVPAKANLHFVRKVPRLGSASTALSTAKGRFSHSSFVSLTSLSWTTHRSIPGSRTELRTQFRRSTNSIELFLSPTNHCAPNFIILKLSTPRNKSELMTTKDTLNSRLDEINRLYSVIPIPNWYQIQQKAVTINTKISP